MNKILIGALAVAAAVIAYLFLVPKPPKPADDARDYAVVARSMIEFQGKLAAVALDQLDHPAGLSIRPTDAEAPIGTLFQPGRSLATDDHSCVPDRTPTAYRANSTFPAYRVTGDAAASVGIGEGVLGELASVGAKVDRGQTIQITFDDVHRAYLDDNRLKQLLAMPGCAAALADGTLSIIRGYFTARRRIDIATTDTGSLHAGLKIGSFDVSRGAGDATVELADAEPFGFLQLYTTVTPVAASTPAPVAASDGGGAPGSAPVQTAAIQTAKGIVTLRVGIAPMPAATRGGLIYFQRDVADRSDAYLTTQSAFRGGGFQVVDKVEAVPSVKMPRLAEVRYFNTEDEPRAQRALDILARQFPTARLRRIPLPSPSGQLEVWLPKAA